MKSKRKYQIIKQILDTTLGIVAFFLCIPIFIIIGIIVKLTSKGKIIYKQERLRKKWKKILLI